VTALSEVDCGPIVPQRSELTIDMRDWTMSAAGRAVSFDSAAHTHVLERYLSLVYVLRNHEPGTVVPLRDEDVAILAASLAEREELITEQLRHAMEDSREEVSGLVSWFRKRLWVPRAGALVGVVSVGTLIMVSSDNGLSHAPPSSLPEPDVDTDTRRPVVSAGQILARNVTPIDNTPDTQSASTPSRALSSPDLARPTPTTAVGQRPATHQAEVGAAAEALLPFNWEDALPGWSIVYSGPDGSFRGLTYPYEQTIEMFVRDTDTPEALAGILAHEIGHAIDVTYFGNGERDEWRDARRIGDVQWWPDAYASDFQSGAGDFAEAFAYWALKDPSSSQIAGTPTASELEVLEDLLREIL